MSNYINQGLFVSHWVNRLSIENFLSCCLTFKTLEWVFQSHHSKNLIKKDFTVFTNLSWLTSKWGWKRFYHSRQVTDNNISFKQGRKFKSPKEDYFLRLFWTLLHHQAINGINEFSFKTLSILKTYPNAIQNNHFIQPLLCSE